MYLKGKLKDEIYNSKSVEINKEIVAVNNETAKYKVADKAYFKEIEGFLAFCNEAPALFKSSRPALKQELLHFVVSNLSLKDGKVDFKLKMPFSIVAKFAKTKNWAGPPRVEQGKKVLETFVIPFHHGPKRSHQIITSKKT